jgi:reactive intermediate/imine deaminase
MKQMIYTSKAPKTIGTYSQAIKTNQYIFLSGQIPKSSETDQMISNDFKAETKQVFLNLSEVCKASGGSLNNIVKLTIFLTDLSHFSIINEVMTELFEEPYPARSTIEVKALPAGARVEIEAIMSANI